ncbi:YicC/YloC family endoribonuclease [Marinicrinis lubricantis]|uniref:YicC/YloC family endoribonuclease n=1 Tax=Marinicrinis lubricantis TaxID=2086470 RepID=A0ABW1IMQ5_9BACL
MLYSMTGFGLAESQAEGFRMKVEIKSVNHRYLEVTVRTTDREWIYLEDGIRRTLQERIKRGRVDVHVTIAFDASSEKHWEIDWAAADGYVQAARQLQAKYELDGNLTLQDLLNQPQLLRLEERASGAEAVVEPQFMKCLDRAIEALLQMRQAEGAHLRDDLLRRLASVEAICRRMTELQPAAEEQMRQRLRQRIENLLQDEEAFDDNRFAMEVALMTEKADITEELTRLQSHISQLKGLLDVREPVGRKIDFLIQEMNREINTIGSKSHALEIIQSVVDLKSELEKIREQVQNIE